MALFVEVLGFIASALDIASFDMTYFSPKTPAYADTVQVKVAAGYAAHCIWPCNSPWNSDPSGTLEQVNAFDYEWNQVGSSSSVHFDAGATWNILINTGGRDAAYLRFVGSTDGMCISWVAVTNPSGGNWAFVGDWWKLCVQDGPVIDSPAQEWYYGNVQAGYVQPDRNSTPWYPLCGWLDGGGSCNHQVRAMMANLSSIQAPTYHTLDDLVYFCNPPNMWWSSSPWFTWVNDVNPNFPYPSTGPLPTPNAGGSSTSHCTKKRDADTSLVRSDIWSHNATVLCQSPYSRGPDFISLAEGMHCDMESRIVTPLCDRQADDDCFSVDEKTLQGQIKKRSVHKQYARIVNWNHEELQAKSNTADL